MARSGTVRDVMAMYTKWPYPSRIAGKDLIHDLASLFLVLFPGQTLSGLEVLDAGCGTGHRLVAFAKRFPAARFTGVDITERSLAVARELCIEHGVTNVRLLQRDLRELGPLGAFDLVTATGVLHHLENPAAGLTQLCRLLKPDGLICAWLYHSIGEFKRLNARELLRTLWTDDADLMTGIALMRDLELSLDARQYGSSASHSDGHVDGEGIHADAFMHPIVNAYRFGEALTMCAGCQLEWAAVNGINKLGESYLVDLDDVEEELRPLCVPMDTLLRTSALMSCYRSLSKMEKLRVCELLTQPTGFTVLAGRGSSLSRLGTRLQGNHVRLPVAAESEEVGTGIEQAASVGRMAADLKHDTR